MPQRRLRFVSSVTESRGIQYSAEAAGGQGSIRCHVIRRRLVRERRAQYSIVVCNGTGDDAQAFAFVPDARDGSRRTIVQTQIGPQSDFSTTVALELVPPGIMPELRVAVTSGATRFTLEVPALGDDSEPGDVAPGRELALPPVTVGAALQTRPAPLPDFYQPPVNPAATAPAPPRTVVRAPLRARSSPPVLPVLLVFALILAAVGYAIGRPQIAALRVPGPAAAGAGVTIGYRAIGLGAVSYELLGPDGTIQAGGPLERGAGEFALTLPAAPNVPAYLIRLTMSGPAGSAQSEAYLRVAPPPAPVATHAPVKRRAAPSAPAPPQPPQIRSLALDRSTLASGETLTVYYDVDAAGGSVALFDPASQITYGKADFAPSGQSTFTAPHVEQSRILTVVVSARRGPLTTQSRIAVSVTPLDAAGADVPAAGPDPAAADAPAPSSTAIVAPAVVRGGKPVRVDVTGAGSGLRIVLLDGTGRELEHRDLAAGSGSTVFAAPQVRVPTRFLFEATYPHGVGSETQVRAITVMP